MEPIHWIRFKLTKNSSFIFIFIFIFIIIIIIIVTICVLLVIPPLVFRSGFPVEIHPPHHFQVCSWSLDKVIWTTTTTTVWRRMLSGPGSSPPRCAWKCGWCTPCKPIHVTVPSGTPVTAEYYPETWRCKCGSKLYMP